MTDTTTEMIKTARILDRQIIAATMNENKKWQKKNQMLNKVHISLRDAIDILTLMAIEEGVEQETIVSELSGAEEEAFQYRGVKLQRKDDE